MTDDLNYSRDIYARRAGAYPQVKKALEFFQLEIKAEYQVNRYASKYRDHIRIFILDLLVAECLTPGMYLTYSRNKNDYRPKGRYGKIHLSYGITQNIVKYLENHGYIEHHPGVKNVKLPRIRATKKLIDLLLDSFQIEVGMYCWDYPEDYPTVVLRANKERKKDPHVELGYEDTAEIRQMKKNMDLFNRNLERHAVFLYLPDNKYKKMFIRMQKERGSGKGMADFTRKWNIRVFNNGSWTQGGRLYGGCWQNIPREYRQYLRLNDKDTVECDYSGLHINMLYARDGLEMPDGDVYHLLDPRFPDPPDEDSPEEEKRQYQIFRDFVKRLQLILLNASSENDVRRAIYTAVHKHRILKLPKEVPSTRIEDIRPLIEAFKDRHKPISQYFMTREGIKLQYLDSQMAEKVLLHFSRMRYPILPVHDSFIIHHGLEQELKDCMNKAFRDRFGVNIQVDLKFNSITERQKRDGNKPYVCDESIIDIIEDEKEYSIYYNLLDQFRRYKNS